MHCLSYLGWGGEGGGQGYGEEIHRVLTQGIREEGEVAPPERRGEWRLEIAGLAQPSNER